MKIELHAKVVFAVVAVCLCTQACQRAEPVLSGPRADILKDNITRWGREHIGTKDDSLVDWRILSSRDDEHLSYVQVEPIPKKAGYDEFVFVISFSEEPANLMATYCLKKDGFYLFSYNPSAWGMPDGPFTWDQFDQLAADLPIAESKKGIDQAGTTVVEIDD